MENKILPFQTTESGQPTLTEKEYNEAIESILPLSSDKLRKKLYWEAEKAVRIDGLRDRVPVMRLSRILYSKYMYETVNYAYFENVHVLIELGFNHWYNVVFMLHNSCCHSNLSRFH